MLRSNLNSFFNCHNLKGIQLFTRQHNGLSNLREDKFKHSFQDSLYPICGCGTDVESYPHFSAHFPQFQNKRLILLSTVKNIDIKLLGYSNSRLTQILFFAEAYLNVNPLLRNVVKWSDTSKILQQMLQEF